LAEAEQSRNATDELPTSADPMSRQLDLAVCSHDELYNRLQVFGGLLLLDCSTEMEGPLILPAERIPPPNATAAPPPTSKARVDHILLLSEAEVRCPALKQRELKQIIVLSGADRSWALRLSQALRYDGKASRVTALAGTVESMLARWPFLTESPRKQHPSLIDTADDAQFLFLGNRRMAYDEQIVRRLKITHIVDFHDECVEPEEPHRAFVSYTHCRVDDRDEGDLAPHLPKAFEFIEAAHATGGRVLVHCNAGVSRSATCVAYFLARREGLRFSAALKRVEVCREVACPSLSFRVQACALLGEPPYAPDGARPASGGGRCAVS